MSRLTITVLLIAFYLGLQGQSYPEGFIKETAYNQFDVPAGMLHTESDVSFVWELSGKVWLIDNGIVHEEAVIDISEEVAFWGDHGMIGAALDPDFLTNGYIYLYYSVDRHYLLNFGTDQYDPNVSETSKPCIGRITRYTLNTVDFQFVIPDSRFVLLGSEISNGIPIATASHGVGSLVFGADGSLLASCGDGSTWVLGENNLGYNGTGPVPTFGYDELALEDGILKPQEFLGSYRSQYLNGLNGKLLRIDPQTGLGIANNPFFDDQNPDSPMSKVWALGFRNPYRMCLKPGTGDENIPGTVYISDVGDWVWEEINVVSEGGKNYGWPMFQGQGRHDLYRENPTYNTMALNPLSQSSPNCNEFFKYQDLVKLPNASHSVDFPNSCNPFEIVPEDIPTFMVERPALAYAHHSNDLPIAAIPTFDEAGNASFESVESSSIVTGENFTGNGGSGGTFLTSDSIPAEYQGWYVQADYSGWLRAFEFNEFDELEKVELWDDSIGAPIHITKNPSDGCIYVTSISPSEIYKICFGGNRKPAAIANLDTLYGPSPQNIVLDGAQSFDLDGEIVNYSWTLSNGESFQGAEWNYTAVAPSNDAYYIQAKLLVVDNEGAKDSTFVHISLNNTPPKVDITSITDGQLLSIYNPSFINLIANVEDEEHAQEQMVFDWTIYLHHNTHFHRLDEKTGNNTNISLTALGCNNLETYWYRIKVDVTDPGNLKSTDSVELWPDCEGLLDQSNSNNEYTLYPNPSSDKLFIDSNFNLGKRVEYTISSADGKEVGSSSIPIYGERRNFAIDISHLAQGSYVLELKSSISAKQLRFVKIEE